MSTVIQQLEREWKRLALDERAAAELRAACAVADSATNLAELEAYVRQASRADADQVLLALVGPASNGGLLEARVLLQLLLPGVRRLARRWWSLGDRDERAAAAVAAVWSRICHYPVDRRPMKVAANILLDAEKELRRAAQRRGLPADALPDELQAPAPNETAAEELIQLLARSVEEGVLSERDAQMIAAFRISGTSLRELAGRYGASYRTVKRRRANAERSLIMAAAA
jgi:hypothetical protein